MGEELKGLLTELMSPSQIEKAQNLANECLKKPIKAAEILLCRFLSPCQVTCQVIIGLKKVWVQSRSNVRSLETLLCSRISFLLSVTDSSGPLFKYRDYRRILSY